MVLRHFSAGLLFLFLSAPLSLLAEAPSVSGDTRPGILLLRNGEVIEGAVELVDNRYHVTLASGQISIKASDVELCCSNLEECYQHRRDAIEVGKVQDHVALADWCLRQNLKEHAAGELKEALAADPSHPKIAILERRLRLALEETTSPQSAIEGAHESPGLDELDRLVRAMPEGTMEAFTSTIQPLLINSCSTAGCHGAQSTSSLRLMRVPVGRTLSRRVTQRNLFATLKAIDRKHVENSPLLTAPVHPHATAQTAIFNHRDAAQYQQLVNWTYRVAGSRPPDHPSTVDDPASSLLQTVKPAAVYVGRSSSRSTAARIRSRRTAPAASATRTRPIDIPAEPSVKDAAGPDNTSPPDSTPAANPSSTELFDPEILDQRYLDR